MSSADTFISHRPPRSRRVGIASPPDGFTVHQDSTPLLSPPTPPVRSPLRPMAKSISNSSTATAASIPTPTAARPARLRRPATPPPLDIDDFASIVEDPLPSVFQIRRRSFLILGGLSEDPLPDDPAKTKALPPAPIPDSPIDIEDEFPSSSSSSIAQQAPMTKRQHALHELLSSERAYASDLALIRQVHIPLALGHPIPLNGNSLSLPSRLSSSSSSSRTHSMSSDSSSSSLYGAPMSVEDVRTIFSNITELAVFSDQFCDALEQALGSTLDGGEGEDRVGALFLEIIPELEKPYKYYINKHPAALAHLQALPQTPALTSYLAHTQTVASLHSHAWDLASLLIKPVQRLLKYSLLLGAIIDETPDTHRDKENLKHARIKMEGVAHDVNEGRRRAEVVKEVLTSKKRAVNVSVAASVNITRMKSLRHGGANKSGDANGEAALVERMHAELKRVDMYVQQLGKNVVDWAKMMGNVVRSLRVWAIGFGKVIGLSAEQGSEAFDAFIVLVEAHLLPLCHRLEADVNEKLLKELAHLLMTMNQPLKLLASMEEQEPFHYHLLTMNVSAKNRPAPALLAASTNYLALRGQLAAELPAYLKLLHRGLAVEVRRLAQIQAEFWRDVRDQWADLWEMLRVEGEMNAGHEETMAVWQARWWDVDEVVAGLKVTQPPKKDKELPPPYTRRHTPMTASVSSRSSSTWTVASMGGDTVRPPPETLHHVSGMLASLNPAHATTPPTPPTVSAPFPLGKGARSASGGRTSRARGSSDASTTSLAKNNAAKPKKKQHSLGDPFEEFVAALPGSPVARYQQQEHHYQHQHQSFRRPQLAHAGLPRTKSMPLPSERTMSHASSTSSKTLVEDGSGSVRLSQEVPLPLPGEDDKRGRTSRKSSLRQKFAGTLRTPSKQRPSSTGSNPNSNSRSLHVDTSSSALSSPSASSTFFDDADAPPVPAPRTPQRDSRRDSWGSKRGKYWCRVVHACKPPAPVSYYSFPFFTLRENELYEVLQEAGHPSIHPKLPLYVDDGEDCLLLCRDEEMNVGWALASFLAPIEEDNNDSGVGG